MPCESLNLNYDASMQKAYYTCSDDGGWVNLNTSMCCYISDTTKILEQFSKVNSDFEESAKHFRNYTLNKNIFKDLMDLVFAIDTVENYIKLARFEHIANILMDVVDNFLDLPTFYLRETDIKYGTSRKLLNATEALASLTSSSAFHKVIMITKLKLYKITKLLLFQANMALEVFQMKKDGFLGMKCTWYVNPYNRKDSIFSCGSSPHHETVVKEGKI